MIGLPALRIKGLFLAVVTLGFALAAKSYFLNSDFFEWVPSGSERIPRYPLFGHISLELFGHMFKGVLDYEAHYATVVEQLADDLGL